MVVEVRVAIQSVGSPRNVSDCLTEPTRAGIAILKEAFFGVEGWRELLSWVFLNHNAVQFLNLYRLLLLK